MLTLSKRVEYGLMAILHMADMPASELATAKLMAERYSIPAELLGKVLQALARAGVVSSTPGVHGGYRLNGPLDTVNLGRVIEAVEGPVMLTDCQEDPERCGQYHTCTIKEPIQHIHAQLVRYIHNISLNQFRAPPALENVT
ncbi:MAG TPA: Rrf2 family transcriptional regulator [Kiritimatiellia bacterium]|nr:Rrf2 family transcriptional regulator [Kiritimatiellia bacterium]